MLNNEVRLNLAFRALSDATRRNILARLSKGAIPVNELAKPLGMSLPAVMQHIAVLEKSGLVRSIKVGRVRTCIVEPKALNLVDKWINQRRAEWEMHFDHLGEYLKTLDKGDGPNARDK